MLLLALFTVLALRAVGSLLMGALLVIPALSARLLAHSPKQMVIWAFLLAQFGVTVGLWSSAALNIATGLSSRYGALLCTHFYSAKTFYQVSKPINRLDKQPTSSDYSCSQ